MHEPYATSDDPGRKRAAGRTALYSVWIHGPEPLRIRVLRALELRMHAQGWRCCRLELGTDHHGRILRGSAEVARCRELAGMAKRLCRAGVVPLVWVGSVSQDAHSAAREELQTMMTDVYVGGDEVPTAFDRADGAEMDGPGPDPTGSLPLPS